MANYNCYIRTNYFRVKNAEEFEALMARVYGTEEKVEFWSKEDNLGRKMFAFGCYGGISGLRNAEDDEDEDWDESAYDEFISALQKCVADDDAIIIMEIGHEKMRYLTGIAEIVTSNEIKAVSLEDIAVATAREMLGNKDAVFQTSY